MIRRFHNKDLNIIMEIWLEANIQAHSFLPKSYWEGHFTMVKGLLPKAEVFVYEREGKVTAFIGLQDHYIAGIFVKPEMQSQGVGKELLDYCKELYETLLLHVYEENQRGVNFYKREGFHLEKIQIEKETGKVEYEMKWIKNPVK